MSMDFFLRREDQTRLRDALHTIPALVEDLAITITRQAHIGKNGLDNTRRPRPESRLPYHIAAAETADNLHTTLTKWVRFTSENRRIHYRGHNDTTTLARWLHRNITGLALTPGSETAVHEITTAINDCRDCIDLPPDDHITIDPARVEAANRSIVTLSTITTIAAKLGEIGAGLNRDRLRLLAKRGDIQPAGIDPDTGTRFFRLGDVLHAHHARKRRNEH